MNEGVVYLPLIASRRDTGGRQAIAFATAAMRQALAVFHHTTLSLLRVKGHLLNWKVLIFLFCFSLQSIKYRNYRNQDSMTSLRNGSNVTYREKGFHEGRLLHTCSLSS